MPAMNKLGCPNNWLRAGHKCYKFNTGASHTWQESSDACHRTNSRLLQITTKDQKVNQTMIFIDSYSQQQFCCMSRLSNNFLNTIEVFFYPWLFRKKSFFRVFYIYMYDKIDLTSQDWIQYITMRFRAFAFWSGLHFHPGDKTWYWTNEQKASMDLV